MRSLIFLVSFCVLLFTLAPSISVLDSAEFAIGADTLGFVHSPAYPLYLTIAHLFTYLPIGNVAYRVNLFSALALALTAPFLYSLLMQLLHDYLTALTATLIFLWSYSIWINGLIAEVYAPQLLTLTILGCLLVRLSQSESPPVRLVLTLGVWFGLTVAMAPMSILFTGGLVATLLYRQVPYRLAFIAALLSLFVFLLSLLYFPIRYADNPAFNTAGHYDEFGNFHPINLQSVDGIWTVISGQQFKPLFFEQGYLPTLDQLRHFIEWFGGNFLWIGLIIGGFGLVTLWQNAPTLLIVWLMAYLPYTYFFLTYGAADVQKMFSPTYLLWIIPFAYGWHRLTHDLDITLRISASIALIGIFLVVNFPLVDVSDDRSVQIEAEILLEYLPEDSLVFGQWLDILPLQYMQIVENQRPDLTLYNIYLFNDFPFFPNFSGDRPIFILGENSSYLLLNQESFFQIIEHTLPIGNEIYILYELR